MWQVYFWTTEVSVYKGINVFKILSGTCFPKANLLAIIHSCWDRIWKVHCSPSREVLFNIRVLYLEMFPCAYSIAGLSGCEAFVKQEGLIWFLHFIAQTTLPSRAPILIFKYLFSSHIHLQQNPNVITIQTFAIVYCTFCPHRVYRKTISRYIEKIALYFDSVA